MAVWIADEIEKVAQEEMEKFVMNEVVPYAKELAPEISGRLKHSIRAVDQGNHKWIVSTHALGDNGFAYPARVESGQGVHAKRAKVLVFTIHGETIRTPYARPSKRKHFMRNTVNAFK